MEMRQLPAAETPQSATRRICGFRLTATPRTVGVPDADRELVAVVSTRVDERPEMFDRPDRLVVGDISVREPHRGTGFADRLLERATADARERGCGERRRDVDEDNERAAAVCESSGSRRTVAR